MRRPPVENNCNAKTMIAFLMMTQILKENPTQLGTIHKKYLYYYVIVLMQSLVNGIRKERTVRVHLVRTIVNGDPMLDLCIPHMIF